MRTLAEMIGRVRRYVDDVQELQWTDAQLEEYLVDAAKEMWETILHDSDGRRTLRTYSSAASFVASTETIELPADCAALDRVECRDDSDERWYALSYRDPQESICWGPRSGNAHLSGRYPTGRLSLWWYDDVPEGYVRIWPVESTPPTGTYRFRYFQAPLFPTEDAGTFADPDADGEAEYDLPGRVDEAAEYLAAAKVGLEEYQNGFPVGTHGVQYARVMQAMIGRGASVTKPRARYIRRAGR